MKENKLIDDLLSGGILLGIINQVEVVAEEEPTTVVNIVKVKGDVEEGNEEEEGIIAKVEAEAIAKFEEDEEEQVQKNENDFLYNITNAFESLQEITKRQKKKRKSTQLQCQLAIKIWNVLKSTLKM
jgi:hypothetical protein